MTIPRDIPAVLEALAAVALEDAAAQAALGDALSKGAPVERIVGAFDALGPVAGALSGDDLIAYAGAAYLIAAHGWWGRQADATAALVVAMHRIPQPEPPPAPSPPPLGTFDQPD